MIKKIIACVVLIGAVAGGYYYYKGQHKPAATSLTLYGNVEIRQADLGFKVAGRINKLYFKEGDHVKKGQLLATLDTKSYEAEQKKTEADIANLQATKDNADANYERRRTLYAQGAIAKEQLETYRKLSENASAQLEAAKQVQVMATDSLDDTRLLAPSDGILTVRSKEEGSIVAAGSIVYTLALTEPVWVRAYVDEAHLGDVAYGTKAVIESDSVDPATGKKKSFPGHIGYISPTAEFTPKTVQTENLRTDLVYRIRVYVDSHDPFIRQGMPVTVKIDLQQAK